MIISDNTSIVRWAVGIAIVTMGYAIAMASHLYEPLTLNQYWREVGYFAYVLAVFALARAINKEYLNLHHSITAPVALYLVCVACMPLLYFTGAESYTLQFSERLLYPAYMVGFALLMMYADEARSKCECH